MPPRWKAAAFRRLQPKLGKWAEIAVACDVSEMSVRNWANEEKPNGPDAPNFKGLCILAKAKLGWTYERTFDELYG